MTTNDSLENEPDVLAHEADRRPKADVVDDDDDDEPDVQAHAGWGSGA